MLCALVMRSRRQSRRLSKQITLPKHGLELRTGSSSAPECEADCCEKGNQRQEVKSSVIRGKSMKTAHRKKPVKEQRSSKTSSLVTLRASQEDEEADDFEPDDEDECFALEEVNKAPVFVPVGLRSPKPIPVQIEETMEEVRCSCVLCMHVCLVFFVQTSFYSNCNFYYLFSFHPN